MTKTLYTYLDLDGNVTKRHNKIKRGEYYQKSNGKEYLITFYKGEIATLQRVRREN